MAKMTQLTKHCWLVKHLSNSDYTGLLSKTNDGYEFLGKTEKLSFETLKEAEKIFGKLKEVKKKESDIITDIDGYPIKHDDINIISTEPPIYNKREGGVEFIAGYCCIKFERGWALTFCPKYTTFSNNESLGPFRNKIEAQGQVKIMNTRMINESF